MRQLRHPDGSPVTLGLPVREIGTHPGVTVTTQEDQTMAKENKAPYDGLYALRGHRFLILGGEVLPEGATFIDPDEEAAEHERAALAEAAATASMAAEQLAKKAAPENRAV